MTFSPVEEQFGTGWRERVLSPRGEWVTPARAALVPRKGIPGDLADIEWVAVEEGLSSAPEPDQVWLVDFGKKTTGHLEFRLEGLDSESVRLQTGPTLKMCRFEDELEVPCGETWLEPKFRAFRFAKIMSTEEAGRLPGLMLRLRFSACPVEYEGHFECSDELLNEIWYRGAYTIQLCMQKHCYSGAYLDTLPADFREFVEKYESPYGDYVIWDGPRRDREVWVGDMWPECLSMLYAFNELDVMRNSLYVVTQLQREDGMLPGSGLTRQPFAEYACWWVVLLEAYRRFSGDESFVRDVEEPLRRQLDWLFKRLAENDGFLDIGHRQTWAWTLARRGVVTGSQCVAYQALMSGASLMREVFGDEDLAEDCADRAVCLREQIGRLLWNEEKGVFRDSLDPVDGIERVSCDANALAVLFGVATDEQAERALAYLRENLWTRFGTRTLDPVEGPAQWNWAHNHNIWPFVVGLELESRFEARDYAGAFDLMRRCWGNMVAHDAESFWEMVDGQDGSFVTHRQVADTGGPDTYDSYAHGWSAGVTYMLQAYVLGIRPTEPGFARFSVDPVLMDLEWAEGEVPTPHGAIALRVERSGGMLQGTLRVPEGTSACLRAGDAPLGPGEHDFRMPAE